VSKATYPLKLPASVKAAATLLAREDGVSLNQWIASAVAQKVGAIETAARFFRRHGGDAKPEDLRAVLNTGARPSPGPRRRVAVKPVEDAVRRNKRALLCLDGALP